MTPQRDKPPVLLSAQFQSAALIAIFTVGVTIAFKVFTFASDFAKVNENHERRITNVEKQQERFDNWREAITQNAYFRQGRPIQNQTP